MSSTILINSKTASTAAAKHSLAVIRMTAHNPFAASAGMLPVLVLFIYHLLLSNQLHSNNLEDDAMSPARTQRSTTWGDSPVAIHSNNANIYIIYQIKDK